MIKLHARDLRDRKPTEEELASISRRPLYIVLDNVLDTYNIGGIFRLADAVGAAAVYICGESETPPSSRIHKAAVGLEEWVPWKYFKTAEEGIVELRENNPGIQILAVEQSPKSIPYTEVEVDKDKPIAIVVGHETDGVGKGTLELVDQILELPMFGVNKSLNVIVSAAIGTYKILEKLDE